MKLFDDERFDADRAEALEGTDYDPADFDTYDDTEPVLQELAEELAYVSAEELDELQAKYRAVKAVHELIADAHRGEYSYDA